MANGARELNGGPKRGWDAGLEYNDTYQRILLHLNKKRKPQDVVLLIQLRNGSRVGEAVDALKEFCESGKIEVYIRVEKHRNSNDQRLMMLPEELRTSQGKILLQSACSWISGIENPKAAIKTYCKRTYGFNTHGLRYAFVTYMLGKGVNPSIIAKITGHKNLSYILHYTELKTAEDLLRGPP